MRFLKKFPAFLFPVLSSFAPAQNVSAYVDYKNAFHVFEDGLLKQVEFNPVKKYVVGGNAVAYKDNSESAMAFYKGKKYDLRMQEPQELIATDNLLIFYGSKILKVFDRGAIVPLSPLAHAFFPGDSVVAFFDQNAQAFKAYYNGEIIMLEDFIAGGKGRAMAADNLVAWMNRIGKFNVFYRGEITELESTAPADFRAGANIVAYTDKFSQSFKAFYKGEILTLESQFPKIFRAADDLVVYIDHAGKFKVFYDGKTTELSPFEPAFYAVEDNLLLFGDFQHFMLFYKGTIFKLESYVPSEYKMDFNAVAWKDKDGYLKIFQDGKTEKPADEKISSFELNGNVLRFTTGLERVQFFMYGKKH